jgi:translation initiation factor IF-1
MSGKSADKIIRVVGRVVEALEGGLFLVQIRGNGCVNAESSARIKVRLERVKCGDEVVCEQSPYDPSKVRIVQVVRREQL